MIEVKHLSYHYGDYEVLKDVNLSLEQGKTLVILGRSGCGKSTLLKLMLGLLTPTSGEIWINGVDVVRAGKDELDRLRTIIGVLFQSGALLTSLTVAENVALPLRERVQLSDKVIDIMVRMKLDAVGLSGFEDLYPAQLSGGMRKRAGLARAIVMDPKILFCDEPWAGLDPIVAAEINELILELKDAFSMTIVIVTHNIQRAFFIADELVVMERGRVVAGGSPEEVKASRNEFVRQFLAGRPSDKPIDAAEIMERLTGARHG